MMEPIPESVIAAEELGPFSGTEELLEQLVVMGDGVRRVVPECVGLSLASRWHGVTFTLVSSGESAAVLDAAQYLEDGPCVESADLDEVVTWGSDDVLGERAWQVFSRLSAAYDVRSSLTLPIRGEGPTAGTVNLYASAERAFDDKHREVAQLVGAWAEEAVSNADLSFSTRRVAELAPEVLAGRCTIVRASQMLAESLDLDEGAAEQRLADAARRAGISAAQLAEALVRLQQ